jgi:hypothetical protein
MNNTRSQLSRYYFQSPVGSTTVLKLPAILNRGPCKKFVGNRFLRKPQSSGVQEWTEQKKSLCDYRANSWNMRVAS